MLTKNWTEILIALAEYAIKEQQSLFPFLDFVQESFSLLTAETPETEVSILQNYAGSYNWTPVAENRQIKISVRTTENKPGYSVDVIIRDNQVVKISIFTEYYFVDEENKEEYCVKTKTELDEENKEENQFFEVSKTNNDFLITTTFIIEALDLIESTVFKIDTIDYSSFFNNYLGSFRNHPGFVKINKNRIYTNKTLTGFAETEKYLFNLEYFVTADEKYKKVVVNFRSN